MAELKRKPQEEEEEQLSTADLAGRAENAPQNRDEEWAGRPTLVKKEDERMQDGNREKTSPSPAAEMTSTPLFSEGEITELRHRWGDVQSAFVDEPRKAVQEADQLVATVMTRLAEGFAQERSNLEKQWGSGRDVSTEDLRLAMQRYRSFFDRLLNA